MTRRQPYPTTPAPADEPVIWRTIDEKENPEKYRQLAEEEFPGGFLEGAAKKLEAQAAAEASVDVEAKALVGRRGFFTATAAAAAVGAAACIRRPEENILPYTNAPEYVVPGVPLHYATVLDRRGEALGLLVTTHTGRPTKVEGNPDHPSSLGATDLIAQASILDLYDPDRARTPRQGGQDEEWADFDRFIAEHRATIRDGSRLRVLAQPTNSPTFLRLRRAVMDAFPGARFHTWSATGTSNTREGARAAFGTPVNTRVDFERAEVVLALDCDFLGTEPGAVRNTRAFAAGRRVPAPGTADGKMSRLYVVEPGSTITGGNADQRLRLPASQVGTYLRAIAKALGATGPLAQLAGAIGNGDRPVGVSAAWVDAVAADLRRAGAGAVVVVGSGQPPWVHALAHAVNGALGSNGTIVTFGPVADPDERDHATDLTELVEAMGARQVDTLVILGGNPCYDAPGNLGFTEKLRNVRTSIQLSHNRDETSEHVTWHLPRAHEFETWGDQISLDGTLAVQQPLISPLWGGRSDIEILGLLAGERNWRGYHLVRATHRLPEAQWRTTIQRGVLDRGVPAMLPVTEVQAAAIGTAMQQAAEQARPPEQQRYEVVFQPCAKMMDGRHANNAWLQELPEPMTRISWDNAALVSPRTFAALRLQRGNPTVHWNKIKLRRGDLQMEIVAYEQPGVADWTVVLPLGWGRRNAGRYGDGRGYDVNPFRSTDALWFAGDVHVDASTESHNLSQMQEQHSLVTDIDRRIGNMAGRPIAIAGTLDEYQDQPDFAQYRSVEPAVQPLWAQVEYTGHKWGMSIDLNACVGCNACVIACQAENNVSIVGKEQVQRGREMYWLRIDRYFVGDEVHEPGVLFQPVACQQCEEAPCENVCPVNATTHSPEGLNDMAYNRCIGTRYCANNCPYKVRKFNYLNWNLDVPETYQMQKNPNVTVRFRGVMEKCTFCVQRIQEAKIAARREDRALTDGQFTTACAQVCPANAIVFGDLNDAESRIARLAADPRHYKLLAEIGTQPRTVFLARVRNPNSAIPDPTRRRREAQQPREGSEGAPT